MRGKTKRQTGGIGSALTLVCLLFNRLDTPIIILVCLGVSASLMVAFSDYVLGKRRTIAEYIGRSVALVVLCSVIGVIVGHFFWPTVVLNPTKIDVWYPSTDYQFAIVNQTRKDVYAVDSDWNFRASPSDIRFTPLTRSASLNEVQFVAVRCNDPGNNFHLHIFAYHLAPEEKVLIKFGNASPSAISASAKVNFFSTTPIGYVDNGRMTGFWFKTGEDRCQSAGVAPF